MTPKGNPPKLALTTDPMFAGIPETTDDENELVFIYGYVGKVTDETVRLYQGLDLGKFYEIPTDGIVYAEKVEPDHQSSVTKLVLYASTRITYVSSATATLPAFALSEVVRTHDSQVGAQAPSARMSANTAETVAGDGTSPDVGGGEFPSHTCRPGCVLPSGACICAPVDHWLNLDAATANRLGVKVLPASSGAK